MCNDNLSIPRRTLLHGAAGCALAGLTLRSTLGLASEQQQDDPRFFLHLHAYGGFDSTYLFDSRPREFVTAGKKAIYLDEEPELYQGTNGGRTLVTKQFEVLRPYVDSFTILNGVQMATNFDGHDQNSNFLATGNPFGGEYFVPHFNAGKNPKILDFVRTGFFFPFETSNSQNGVPFNAYAAKTLVARIKRNQDSKLAQVRGFVARRLEAAGKGQGKLAAGSRQLFVSQKSIPELETRLSEMTIESQEGNLESSLGVVAQVFSKGIAQSAFLGIDAFGGGGQNLNPDTHAAADAKNSSKLAELIAGQLAKVLEFLKNTPFDSNRSLFDVTTVMYASEFGRTMRQRNRPIEDSGTDHNPLTNTIFLAGKGVRGGQVIGASDFQSIHDVASGAHLQLDPDQIKQMGLPFDHKTATVRTDRPETFVASDYLSMTNVANSLMRSFGVEDSRYWLTERNGSKASIVSGLMG